MSINHDFSLVQLRKALGLAQSEMARRMGLSLRPYQKLESIPRKVRSRHVRLAESVALDVAIEKEDFGIGTSKRSRQGIEVRSRDLDEQLSTEITQTRGHCP